MFKEKELVFDKISTGQIGADMLTKHASVGVVRCNKKLIGMMYHFEVHLYFRLMGHLRFFPFEFFFVPLIIRGVY